LIDNRHTRLRELQAELAAARLSRCLFGASVHGIFRERVAMGALTALRKKHKMSAANSSLTDDFDLN
jgi:hypothetical protein